MGFHGDGTLKVLSRDLPCRVSTLGFPVGVTLGVILRGFWGVPSMGFPVRGPIEGVPSRRFLECVAKRGFPGGFHLRGSH
jgi:hypothetical protein